VSELVDAEVAYLKIRNLVDESAVLRAESELAVDVNVRTSAVHERSLGLSIRTGDYELVRRIKSECSASAQRIRTDMRNVRRDMPDQRSGRLVDIALQRRRTEILNVARISIVTFSAEVAIELIRIAGKNTTGLGGAVRRALIVEACGEESDTLNADLRRVFYLCKSIRRG